MDDALHDLIIGCRVIVALHNGLLSLRMVLKCTLLFAGASENVLHLWSSWMERRIVPKVKIWFLS